MKTLRTHYFILSAFGISCFSPAAQTSSGSGPAPTAGATTGSTGSELPPPGTSDRVPTADASTSTSSRETATTDQGQTTSGGNRSCGPDAVCVPASIQEWEGPAVVVEGTGTRSAPSCPPGFQAIDREDFFGLDAPDAECSCDCGIPSDVSCTGFTLSYHNLSDSNCETPVGTFAIDGTPPFSCNNDISITTRQIWSLNAGTLSASCDPVSSSNIPPTSWNGRTSVCAGLLEPCAEGICAPTTTDERTCLWKSGDTACPAGSPYSTRLVRYASLTDSRNCTECSCGASGDCLANLSLNSQFGCTTGFGLTPRPLETPGVVNCRAYDGPIANARMDSATPDASCTPSGGTSSGRAAPAIPTTFCCTSK